MKRTAIAPSNLALIKYWGLNDDAIRLPTNSSISFNLDNLLTKTTVEFSDEYKTDQIEINSEKTGSKIERVIKHLTLIRNIAGINLAAKVVSKNNFPTATGLSSSASGFAALTVAAVAASGLSLSEKKLSIIARQGSGSACRSIPDAFVEWEKGNDSKSSYAKQIFATSWWDIVDVVCILSSGEKYLSTSKGHTLAKTSPFFKTRINLIEQKINDLKKSISEKNFTDFGTLVESEAIELHAMMLTANPSLLYLYPETLLLINHVKKWREAGFVNYFSLNTGHNVHIICEGKNIAELKSRLDRLKFIKQYIVNKVAIGTRLSLEHLF